MARRLGVQIPDLFEVEPLIEEDTAAKEFA
jgi:hypothetical protein